MWLSTFEDKKLYLLSELKKHLDNFLGNVEGFSSDQKSNDFKVDVTPFT